MKKYLYLGAVAALLLGTASCSSEMEPELTDGTVQFRVELPGAVESRAIADGTTATKLEVACYDYQGNKLDIEPTVKTDFTNRVATVTYKLVKGQTYNFSFFAHADGAPYTFTAGSTLSECEFTVTDSYDNVAGNDESRDAFYAVLTDYEVTATTTDVTLYRPFAQLNFGADDLAAAATAGIIPSQSAVTVQQVSTRFNLSTGVASDAASDLVDASFAAAALPATPDDSITVDGTKYRWMAMNYFLVPANEAAVDVEMTVATNKADVVVPVANVPVQKNHRTNIVGSLFTQDANFNIIIDQNFDQPDNNLVLPFTAPEDVAGAAQEPGATIYVEPNSELNLNLSQVAEGVTIKGFGSTIIFENGNANEHKLNTENITIEDCSIINRDSGTSPLSIYANNATLRNVTFETVNANDAIVLYGHGTDTDGEILIENVTVPGSANVFKALHIFCKGTVRIVNSHLDACYPFNCDGSNCDMVVENSTLLGWTSWNSDYNGDGTQHTVTFNNCNFGKGTGAYKYAVLRPYNTSYFNNCVFSADIQFYPINCTSTFTGCTIPSLAYFLDPDGDSVGSFAIIDGVTYTYNSGGEAWEVVE